MFSAFELANFKPFSKLLQNYPSVIQNLPLSSPTDYGSVASNCLQVQFSEFNLPCRLFLIWPCLLLALLLVSLCFKYYPPTHVIYTTVLLKILLLLAFQPLLILVFLPDHLFPLNYNLFHLLFKTFQELSSQNSLPISRSTNLEKLFDLYQNILSMSLSSHFPCCSIINLYLLLLSFILMEPQS